MTKVGGSTYGMILIITPGLPRRPLWLSPRDDEQE